MRRRCRCGRAAHRDGLAGEIRTPDFLVPGQALSSKLSYSQLPFPAAERHTTAPAAGKGMDAATITAGAGGVCVGAARHQVT